MELLDLLWTVPVAAGGFWWYKRRKPTVEAAQPVAVVTLKREVPVARNPDDQYVALPKGTQVKTKFDVMVVQAQRYTKQVQAHGLLGDEPIDGMGWLSPKGEFFGNGGGNHKLCAFRILEPGATELNPDRDYERELEDKRYAKLIKNTYYYGWPQPRAWRLSKKQLDIIVHWHVMHDKKMPDWLQQMFVGV